MFLEGIVIIVGVFWGESVDCLKLSLKDIWWDFI